MKEFISEDFLLHTESARRLYHDYAEGLPIIDYHCHLSPEYVADNHVFPNLSKIWLEGDHYKWRALRTNGVDERFITGVFSGVYAIAYLFAGKFIDWMGTRKGYLWAIFIWSAGACLHALCGWATEMTLGIDSVNRMMNATGAAASAIAIVSVYYFIAARVILSVGEAGNFPAAIKVTAEYFPKRDRAFATSLFNAGATVGALIAPLTIPSLARYFKDAGIGNGWEMAFVTIGALGFVWMGLWMVYYKKPAKSPYVNDAELQYIESDNAGDIFPKSTIATIIGIGGMAGGLGCFLINFCSGILFDYAAETNMQLLGFEGKPAGYFIVFCICGVGYLAAWCLMKLLVPRYKLIEP